MGVGAEEGQCLRPGMQDRVLRECTRLSPIDGFWGSWLVGMMACEGI